jgi:phospholipid/cholesterol/gamma-HCH transport system substrate-binding protein
MDSKVNYIVVGLFVLLFGAVLIGGVLWFSTGGVHGSYKSYVMYTSESVSGLNKDAPVRYRGVKVGRVAKIELRPDDPSRVRLLLDIDENTPVKTDTVGTLEMQGLTGLMNVNLTGGSSMAKPLTARRGEIPVITSKPSLIGQLNAQAEALADKLNETTDRLNRLLSDQNQVALSQTLNHLEKVTGALANQADNINDTFIELRRTVHEARLASEELPTTVAQMRKTAASLEKMADEVYEAGRVIRTEVAANGVQVRRFTGETLPAAGAAVDELREAAANMRRMSEQLERDPSVLIYGSGEVEPGPGE